jgi:hypothetical protein
MTDELLDILEEMNSNDERTLLILQELISRMTRMETRLCVLIDALGHGDIIVSAKKGTV